MRCRLVLVVLAVLLVLGCRKAPPPGRPPARRDVTVFAAASLRDAFTTLGQELERTHPEAHVVLSFAGSQALRAQIEHGAPADVFASADQRHMAALVAGGHVRDPRVFANNELVVVVAKARATALRELAQLPEAERIVLGAPEVPIGAYTQLFLERAKRELGPDFRARVEARVVSREPDVRQVLAKVELGEADAGIVYRTDALSAKDRVGVITIPVGLNVVAEYPVAITTHAPAPELARAFVDLLFSAEGARVLKSRGFSPASEKAARP